MKIVMIGAGYVGLVSGACFANFGIDIVCVDNDKEKIKNLKKGIIPIYEPGLEDLVIKNVNNGKLQFQNDLQAVINDVDIIFIAVGTPSRRGDGHADLKYVYQVAKEIGENLEKYALVVNKSTVPVGTAREVKNIIKKINPDLKFDVASNPEFLREGSAIEDFTNPDRVVIGVENQRSEEILREIYKPLQKIDAPILSTNLESAELIKYASNAFLATKISFINEMSHLSEIVGADITAISKGMGLDERIGSKFLQVGPGYGGSCFPKDALALTRIAQDHGVNSKIVDAVIQVNSKQKNRMVEKISHALGGSLEDKRIAVLGLTFKPGTDDMRDAPSITIISGLIEQGAIISAHDPEGVEEAKKLLPKNIKYSDTIKQTINSADAVVLMTEWDQYLELDLKRIKEEMKGSIFVDLRNAFDPDIMEDIGFNYFSVGR
tara:strand:- start:281 stop:1585 length:1305 start_codon:yes stop_codon:yes gene_type:complete